MKDKKVFTIVSIITVIILITLAVFLKFNSKDTKETDSEKFAKEYGMVDENGKTTDNVFVYRTSEQIINILKKGTGIVYLGFPECPWCSEYVDYLNEVAKENGVEKIYYKNILEDRKNNTKEYQEIVKILSDYLQDDEEGNKKLYVPAVIAVKKGKIVGFDDETAWDTKGYENPSEYWEKEGTEHLKTKLACMMKDCKENICTSDCNK